MRLYYEKRPIQNKNASHMFAKWRPEVQNPIKVDVEIKKKKRYLWQVLLAKPPLPLWTSDSRAFHESSQVPLGSPF